MFRSRLTRASLHTARVDILLVQAGVESPPEEEVVEVESEVEEVVSVASRPAPTFGNSLPSSSSNAVDRSRSPRVRPPLPPQPLRPTFAYLPESTRTWYWVNGSLQETSRVHRLRNTEFGSIFVDFHQVSNRARGRPWPRDGARLPDESTTWLRQIKEALPGVNICVISHLNSETTLQNLLQSLNSTPTFTQDIAALFVTSAKTGPSGKVAAVRALTSLASNILIDDHRDTCLEADKAGLRPLHIWVKGRN